MHWFAIDKGDCGFRKCDVYNVDGIAYESIILHGLAILFGPNHGGELKNNSVHLAFSRDGFHMTRPPPPRRPFIRLPPTTNNLSGHGRSMGLSNVQLASGSPIILGDELLFYFGFGAAEGCVRGVRALLRALLHRNVRELSAVRELSRVASRSRAHLQIRPRKVWRLCLLPIR